MTALREAVSSYSRDIQLIISCLSTNVCFAYPTTSSRYVLSIETIRLPRGGLSPLFVNVSQEIEFNIAEARFSTKFYLYSVRDQNQDALISFHYHPEINDDNPIQFPHIHVYTHADERFTALDFQKRHIPSGRIALEDIVRWLISEFAITPLRSNWNEILTETKARFIQKRSWIDIPG